jgi:SAM-dependent methyltransferase
MGVVSRITYKLPSVKALQEYSSRIAAERDDLVRRIDELCVQRDALARERDELAAHCERLDREAGDALDRERRVVAERAQVLSDRDCLERERDELRGHCQRLERQLAEGRAAGQQLRGEVESLHQLHRAFVERALEMIGSEAWAVRMRSDWDERARQNALHFTNSGRSDWGEADYDATGERNIAEYIASDMGNICQGADPAAMRILEIGCGAGRMTRALARLFGEVHAVDVSSEMIRIAKERLAGVPNIVFHHNNGLDLCDLPAAQFDFALSFIVFQHIPSKDVIESYVKEVHRVLKPGRLFKFQVQGGRFENTQPLSTWLGASYTRPEMEQLAARHGFELRYAHGEGTQDFWLWLFKEEDRIQKSE